MNDVILDKAQGSLLGLAVGDALGTTLEFKSPGTFEPIDDMLGGGPFGLAPGEWTDDTSMALCLAQSLIERNAFNPHDQMKKYVQWHEEGYMSSTGCCFDIGNTVVRALEHYNYTKKTFAGSSDSEKAGNGSLMRLAPIPIFFSTDVVQAIRYAGQSSRTTHGAVSCIDACRYMAGLILGALHGEPKDRLLASHYAPEGFSWKKSPLCPDIANIASGSFKKKDPPEIKGTGYVVRSLEAALWAFHRSRNFEEGCLLAANLGDDSDTTAAIYGQLAGAHYGLSGIPQKWKDKIKYRDMILEMALQLGNHEVAIAHPPALRSLMNNFLSTWHRLFDL